MGMKKFLLFVIFLVSFSFLISSVKAVTYISGCSNLDQEGETYYLTQDIIDYPYTCMSVSASYVTLDCQGHIIDGIGRLNGIYILSSVCGNGICEVGEEFSCPMDCPPGAQPEITRRNTSITIKNCVMTDWDFGIHIIGGSSNTLLNITSYSNTYGILFDNSDFNNLSNITVNSNYEGIAIGFSNSNTLSNIISNSNTYGIWIAYSDSNIIKNSIIQNNGEYGIYLDSAGPILIYNNLFNNTNNFYFRGNIYVNNWNTTRQIGTRIYSAGIEIGGNYWTNPTGNGYSDTCADDDRDGFCDLPYDLLGDGTNIDYLPLSDEYSPNLPPEITIFSPLNQSYYGSIDFAFKATDDFDENFTVKAYLNNRLEYENLYYQNNTQISYSKSLPIGTYNFTVYAEDSHGNSLQKEVIFTSLGYCGDNVCQADYENNMNCFKDCGGTARQFTVGIGSVVLAFGGLMLLATAFASSPTEGKDYVFKVFVAVIGIILMVYGIIYLFNL
jgi:parallel beta-helix repeat protein